jgi:hypothetical protein
MAVGDLSCQVVSLVGSQLRDWSGQINDALVDSNNARTLPLLGWFDVINAIDRTIAHGLGGGSLRHDYDKFKMRVSGPGKMGD